MDLIAAHCLIAANEILDRSSKNVMDTRFSVGSWRPFVKGVVRRVLPALNALFKDSVLLPVSENLLFEIRQAHFVGYRLEHLGNVARTDGLKRRSVTAGDVPVDGLSAVI